MSFNSSSKKSLLYGAGTSTQQDTPMTHETVPELLTPSRHETVQEIPTPLRHETVPEFQSPPLPGLPDDSSIDSEPAVMTPENTPNPADFTRSHMMVAETQTSFPE